MTLEAKLIQCGRGPHLVEDDLVLALDSQQLGGAIVDMSDQDPLPTACRLWAHSMLIVTPHIVTVLSMKAVVALITDNAVRLLARQPL